MTKILGAFLVGSIALLALAFDPPPACESGKPHRTQEVVKSEQGTARITIDYCNKEAA